MVGAPQVCGGPRPIDTPTLPLSIWRRWASASPATAVAKGGSSTSSSGGPKKQRLEFGSSQNAPTNASSTSNSTTPRSFDINLFHQDANFKQSLPGQVRASAIFRCIWVTAIRDEASEFAYQATVSISGHVFKGFLYDQGSRGNNSVTCVSQIRYEEGNELGNRGSSPNVNNPADAFPAFGYRRLI